MLNIQQLFDIGAKWRENRKNTWQVIFEQEAHLRKKKKKK